MDPTEPTHRVVDATTNTKTWQWNLPGAKKMVVIFEPSLNNLHIKISAHIPEGRKVRELIRALENPPAADASKPPTDTSQNRSDEDLDAFLRLAEAKPIKMLAILHKLAADEGSTPPPTGAINYYFPLGRFDGSEYYMDDVEDSEEEVANRAGSGRRGVPQKDNKFEERLEDIRRGIRRQKALLTSIDGKHKAIFPEAVHEGDPGGGLRVLCYGTDDQLTGKQVIAFRQVITAYLAYIVTWTTANTVDGRNLTVVQIEAAAVAAIKQNIDDGDYDDLPQTLE